MNQVAKIPCSHRAEFPTNSATVQALMNEAEQRCAAQGQRWTPARRRVYELVLGTGAPTKAYDVMERYRDGPAAKPPTVYRALEFLEQIGLVHRIPSLNAYVACHSQGERHPTAFLICDCCGSAEEFEPDSIESAAAAAHGFAIQDVLLEIHGRCRHCSE